ncbi:MAG: amino acid transport protein [Candidatus Binatia bacterium]
MIDPTSILIGALFSLIGLAVFTYGRRQRTATHTLIGLALMGYPYFVQGTWPLLGVGVALLVAMVVGNRLESD